MKIFELSDEWINRIMESSGRKNCLVSTEPAISAGLSSKNTTTAQPTSNTQAVPGHNLYHVDRLGIGSMHLDCGILRVRLCLTTQHQSEDDCVVFVTASHASGENLACWQPSSLFCMHISRLSHPSSYDQTASRWLFRVDRY